MTLFESFVALLTIKMKLSNDVIMPMQTRKGELQQGSCYCEKVKFKDLLRSFQVLKHYF